MITYILLWLPMLIIAIVNGTLREFVFTKFMSAHSAKQLSTITLIIFFTLYISVVLKRYSPATMHKSLLIGIIWMIMTLFFEFGFGAYRGKSLHAMLEEYNILEGNIWVFVPLTLLLMPLVFYKIFLK